MENLLNEITFCDDCSYSGEPNGCNRKEGICKAHESYFDLVGENTLLHKRLNATIINRLVYYIIPVWDDATMTRSNMVRCGTVDYACDRFIEINGLVLGWDEFYLTQEEAEAKLKGG